MYVVTKMSYPHHIMNKVVARFLETSKDRPKNPAIKVTSVHTECGKVVAIQYQEVSPENLAQKMAETMKIEMQFADIEGYEYDIRATYSLEEALKLVE